MDLTVLSMSELTLLRRELLCFIDHSDIRISPGSVLPLPGLAGSDNDAGPNSKSDAAYLQALPIADLMEYLLARTPRLPTLVNAMHVARGGDPAGAASLGVFYDSVVAGVNPTGRRLSKSEQGGAAPPAQSQRDR